MLCEKERHEPLSDTAWDEAAARACIEAISSDAIQRFSPGLGWPSHPLDGFASEPRHDLYLGSAGTLWAINRLATQSGLGPGEELAAVNRAWLGGTEPGRDPGLLSAGTGVLLVRAMLGGIADVAEELARQIDVNGDSPELEFMWGSPGTMTAALWLHELTGEAVWAEKFRRDAGALWDRLQYVEEAGCHLWVQHLYGHVAPFLGAVHGFAGNAFAIVRGWSLLSPAEQSRWEERLAHSLRATAILEDGKANWPQSIGRHRPGRRSLLVQHCHGAPGMVTCFADFPGSAIDDLLFAAGELVWQAGPLAKGSNLCHGTAGNGFAFLKLYRRSGEALWLNRARRFAMHAIGQQRRDRAAHGQNRYPLWTGDPGLAIYLAQCIAGSERYPTMDEFFCRKD